MSSGGYFCQVVQSGGLATSTAHFHVQEVADYIYSTAAQHNWLPVVEELNELTLGELNGHKIVSATT